MKKQLLFFAVILYAMVAYPQANVAINTDGTPPHVSAMLDVKSLNKGFLAPRVSLNNITDLLTIPTPATGLLVYNTNPAMTNGIGPGYYYFMGTRWTPFVTGAHFIGEAYLGGIIFFLDSTGQHGLMAASADQSGPIKWLNGITNIYHVCNTGDGIGSGSMNTMLAVAMQTADQTDGDFAAKMCVRYTTTYKGQTYGGWFLPSKYELSILVAQRSVIPGLAGDYYWSSTDGVSGYDAYAQHIGTGTQVNFFKETLCRVRAVREF